MEFQDLKSELKSTAIKNGLCEDWQKMFEHSKDKETLVQMYMRGIDFCFSNNYPSVKYIEDNFKGVCEKYGVYVNEEVNLTNVRKLAFVGKCKANLKYDSYEVAQIYAKDDSEVTIEADNHSIITIDCFDNSIIRVSAKNNAQVIINRYLGAEVSTKSDETGIIKIIEHRFKTYQ